MVVVEKAAVAAVVVAAAVVVMVEEAVAVDHDHLLTGDGMTHVVLDLAQAGVGTAACGPGPLPDYLLRARTTGGSLLFSPTHAAKGSQ